ncbi:expressed unknown protein [Ectocarpus siliculosus]|uniref:Uncharacterized protein n=1 Tax=Ectocarpus siliculosus TaxID=2880 RepID=D8LRA4_ECTSI|nr:expressed unknown protein [Ectocarpus siliculosus]|eukprot:CBN75009.1 expressed unknown protein [Ectocarpus siliculosus]
MVEAPDEGGHTTPPAHGGGAAGSSSAPPELYRESSGGRGRGRGGGGGGESSACGSDDDNDEGDDGDGDVGSRPVSSPALLALLLMLKSFLKHLSALRRGDRFCEVWRQFLCCLEILLGTEGNAPPTLVDGAVTGLGAVVGEMIGEGLFASAAAAAATAGAASPAGAFVSGRRFAALVVRRSSRCRRRLAINGR